MSELSSAEITHLAKLARLSLSETEIERFAQELPKIAEFVAVLQDASIDKDDKLRPSRPLEEMRADIAGTSLTPDELQALAPEWQDGQNRVPAVFGESTDV